eukprot:1157410-Pelagomonas_calceolata.AAC.7
MQLTSHPCFICMCAFCAPAVSALTDAAGKLHLCSLLYFECACCPPAVSDSADANEAQTNVHKSFALSVPAAPLQQVP